MITITSEEFKKNFNKYHKIAQKEEILVIIDGKPTYVVRPIKKNEEKL